MTAPVATVDGGAAVVSSARQWLGTPYRHRASVRGAGADCLGLLRGVWRECVGAVEPWDLPPYDPRWLNPAASDALRAVVCTHFRARSGGEPQAGDLVLFALGRAGQCRHGGICAARDGRSTLIHAYSGHGVVETSFDASWRRRLAGVFRFPVRSN